MDPKPRRVVEDGEVGERGKPEALEEGREDGSKVGMLGWVGDFLGREERPMDRPSELKNDMLGGEVDSWISYSRRRVI